MNNGTKLAPILVTWCKNDSRRLSQKYTSMAKLGKLDHHTMVTFGFGSSSCMLLCYAKNGDVL